MDKKFCIVSLGCAKNTIDTEQMLAKLFEAGYEMVDDPDEADIGIVNTCAFIEDAKSESIAEIIEMNQSKTTGAMLALVVTGCMAQRYKEEIFEEMNEVDALVGTGSYLRIAEVCDKLISDSENAKMEKIAIFDDINAPVEECPRVQSTPPYTAFIKIAEGCDNHCGYCVIPSIRGCYRSRDMEKIVEEAENLAEKGVRELIVVAQDISRYGIDLYGRFALPELLKRLSGIEKLDWIRLHYVYPDEITDELIEVIKTEPKILKYIDMPVQHSSDRLLETMNRRYSRSELEALIKRLRREIQGVVIRTSIIVGLPGETEEDFEGLCTFVKKMKFERAGIFTYSQEEGTPAGEMEDQIEDSVKEQRAEHLEQIQSRVMESYNKKRIGQKVDVIVEGYDTYAGYFYSRSYAESPEIDGLIFFKPKTVRPKAGDMVTVKIVEDIDGDIVAEYDESTIR